MKTFVGLHDLTEEDQIDSVVAEIMEGLGAAPDDSEAPDEEPESVEKHEPGGNDHDQSNHGVKGTGSDDTSSSGSSSPEGLPENATKPKEDPEFVQQVYEKYLAQAGPRLAHVSENAGMDQMSTDDHKGIDTQALYGVWEGDTFTSAYTEERGEWQASMLSDMQHEQTMENGQEPGAERQAIIMSGLPGSGKSFLIENDLNQYIDTREFLTINADDIKEKIIFEDTPPEIDDVEGWELASMAHEESSHMRKVWENTAIGSGTNVILDITGANEGKTSKLLDRLKEAGYEITLVHADVTPAEAQASALRRAVVNGNGVNLDRIVPPDFISGMATSGGGDVVDDNFDDYLAQADSAFWFRPYPLNVERDKADHKPTELLWSTS